MRSSTVRSIVRRATADASDDRERRLCVRAHDVDDGDATGDDGGRRRADGGGNGVGVRPGGSEPV